MHPHQKNLPHRLTKTCFCAVIAVASMSLGSRASAGQAQDLTALSLQELLELPISAASRFPQQLRNTPAAAYVITSDDIRRSTATSIPELLRNVPGLHVAQVNSNVWAISARGFNGRFSNKLLVLIDGRVVYSPIFSGEFWDVQDTILENIERIEIIRGPGASIWGANAVNGVINIITKSSRDTHGALASAVAGTDDRAIVGLRYGRSLSDTLDGQISAKYVKRGERPLSSNNRGGNDDWEMARLGGRVDWQRTATEQIAIQGEIFRSNTGEASVVPTLTPPYFDNGAHRTKSAGEFIRGSWDRNLENGGTFALQAYFDHFKRDYWQLNTDIKTSAIEFQHQFTVGESGRLSWGLDYRLINDNLGSQTGALVFTPQQRQYERIGGFAQYELDLVAYDLKLVVGSKVERNTFTGWDVQPTARFAWNPTAGHTFWGAVSRAGRTPSRAETNVSIEVGVIPPLSAGNPSPLPIELRVFGTPAPVSETVDAYELGYRAELTPTFAVDLATYRNSYRHLDQLLPAGLPALQRSPAPLHLLAPILNSQSMSGNTYGFELGADWFITEAYRIRGSYSLYGADLHPSALALNASSKDGSYPHQQFSIGLNANPVNRIDVDVTFRGVDGVSNGNIPRYVTADVRFGWRISPELEVSLAGRNLLSARHTEFVSEYLGTQSTQVPRSAYVQLRWRPS